MRKYLTLCLLTLCVLANAQTEDSPRPLYLKANALLLPAGILNAGAEFQISNKMTLQPEVFISPWKSYMGKYFQAYMAGVDGRYYFNEAFKHWYVGANFTVGRYILQKWNYWASVPYQYEPDSPTYIASDLYQDGFTFILGAVAGYQVSIAEKWNMDFFVGAGSAQSFYKGFHKDLHIRYDTDPDRIYNRSGEFIPYRGGVMISYKIR